MPGCTSLCHSRQPPLPGRTSKKLRFFSGERQVWHKLRRLHSVLFLRAKNTGGFRLSEKSFVLKGINGKMNRSRSLGVLGHRESLLGAYIQVRHALLFENCVTPPKSLGQVSPACFANQKQNGVYIGGFLKISGKYKLEDACMEKYLRDFAKRSSFKSLYDKTVLCFSCSIQKEGPCKTWRLSSCVQGECQTFFKVPL